MEREVCKNYIRKFLDLYSVRYDYGKLDCLFDHDEETKIKRLIAERKYRSVYSFMRYAVRSLITSLEKANDQEKDYWWREDKK